MMTIANAEMAAGWAGPEGDYWAEQDEHFSNSARPHVERLHQAAAYGSSAAVLDIGCGCGKTTRDAARRAPEGKAVGIDLSPQMLERARKLAADEGLTNVEFVYGDAQVHDFGRGAYDIAISSTGCMFFKDPVAAFANIAGALRPEGRLALLVWRELERNDWVHTLLSSLSAGRDLPHPPPDAPGPFSMADPDRVRAILGPAGFVDIELTEVAEPMRFGADVDDAFAFMTGLGVARGLLNDLDEPARETALTDFREQLTERAGPDGVHFDSSAWVVTARRAQVRG